MPLLIIRGEREGIPVNQETADKISGLLDLSKGQRPDYIDLDEGKIKTAEIKFIKYEYQEVSNEYDLDNPEHRQIIKDFEQELIAANRGFWGYCEEKGFVVADDNTWSPVRELLSEFEVVRKKKRALDKLEFRRKKAEEHEQAAFLTAEKVEEMFN